MEDPKSKILQYYRLRPQKKGKLPNFTKDFQSYSQQIDQVIKEKVQFSFNLNKFGIEKNYKLINLKKKSPQDSKIFQSYLNNSNLSIPNHYGCNKYLRYNQTIISPDHKIKIRNKSLKKLKKQQSSPSFLPVKCQGIQNNYKNENKLPKITLTTREKPQLKNSLLNKENLFDSRTARVYNNQLVSQKNQSYVKLFHIVTMGRKQISP